MQRKDSVKTVDEYLKLVTPDKRKVLQQLRQTIREAAPKAEEKISYMIPAYMYHGPLIYFAAQKNFCSLYGVGRTHLKTFAQELKNFEISGTSIHFTPEYPLPKTLVRKIVKMRMKENEARTKAKQKKTKK